MASAGPMCQQQDGLRRRTSFNTPARLIDAALDRCWSTAFKHCLSSDRNRNNSCSRAKK